ncbi:hypothetical protein GCK72_020931 [Caenorhabditis remanei]|uniref:Receptor L-domain domain-containing protein n=1 Tax=Caenorhabditis remanei TaxID=31234 RepID=A0A6A5GGT6_CAERE|nr:hypothetical protein GCK72_020931 [Caenorhabditis remanei]KAF1754370.1 hypothetical protein GCK72_020931 [Caenorhabditis remanei]
MTAFIHTLLFLFFHVFVSSAFSSDADFYEALNNVVNWVQHDPKCVFNKTILDSETIKSFPDCETVFAIIIINENTDLTSSQIKKYFSKLVWITGGLRVENSNLTDLAFLPKPEQFTFCFYCENYGVYIRNNSNLVAGFKLPAIYISGNEDGKKNCRFEVQNNPKLNAGMMCNGSYLHTDTDIKVVGNLKNCGCTPDVVTENCLYEFAEKMHLAKGLHLTKLNDTNQLIYLSNVNQITGAIDIQNTNIRDLSFLKSIRNIDFPSVSSVVFNLQNNPEMTRFALPNISSIDILKDTNLFNLENLHPDFCLTIEELIHFFFRLKVLFQNIHAKLCNETGKNSSDLMMCRFESMSKLPDNCNIILGDLKIESGDEMYIVKLDSVYYLFGSLTIRYTKLEKMENLQNLANVAYFGINPVIQIVSNPNLKEVVMPLQSVITRDNRDVIFQDNHPGILNSTGGVCGFTAVSDAHLPKKPDLNFIGGDCGGLLYSCSR